MDVGSGVSGSVGGSVDLAIGEEMLVTGRSLTARGRCGQVWQNVERTRRHRLGVGGALAFATGEAY
ncbi:hypothetical protein MMPV_006783 [Pyropia vietnamensis]